MPSPVVAALLAPLLELQSLVGPGRFRAGVDPAAILRDAGAALDAAASDGGAAARRISENWSGAAADAAAKYASSAFGTVIDAAGRSGRMAATVGTASDAVARAHTELQRIVEDFAAKANALEPQLPRSAPALMKEARRALNEAIDVIRKLEAELDGHAAELSMPAPTVPAPSGWQAGTPTVPAALPAMSTAAPAGGLPYSTMSAPSHPLSGLAGGSVEPAESTEHPRLDVAAMGGGVAVRLPDGRTVLAPNPVAASAVRHALTQLGVPYQWGGTTPGVGLDCSGLTQWAYHEAGLDLPRLAQEQDVGAAVAQNALLPGDLAVWDGHVAMIVGDGTMIEAGDPVQLSPIRTTNAGQGFHGFFRPTAD